MKTGGSVSTFAWQYGEETNNRSHRPGEAAAAQSPCSSSLRSGISTTTELYIGKHRHEPVGVTPDRVPGIRVWKKFEKRVPLQAL